MALMTHDSLETVDEAELAQLALTGDAKAADALYRRHVKALYGYAYFRVGQSKPDAEDIVQNVFMQAFSNLALFNPGYSFRAWLHGICKQELSHFFRKRKEPPARSVRESAQEEQYLDESTVNACLAMLPDQYRQVLTEKYQQGKSAEQIATATGKSVAAVYSLLERARQAFKELYEQETKEPL